MQPWFWAVCLLAVGLAMAVMEVFLPSGGILGFLAVLGLVGAVVMAFREGVGAGLGVLAAALVGVPLVIALGLKLWPKTKIGRRMLLEMPQGDEVLPDIPRQRQYKALVGRVGVTKSKMLPSGAVLIDGRTIDAVSEGVPIEAGQKVRVIDVRGNRVIVRPIEAETGEVGEDAGPLERPIDSVSPDPFRDPPA